MGLDAGARVLQHDRAGARVREFLWDAKRTLPYAFSVGGNGAFMGDAGRGFDLPEGVSGRDRAGARGYGPAVARVNQRFRWARIRLIYRGFPLTTPRLYEMIQE